MCRKKAIYLMDKRKSLYMQYCLGSTILWVYWVEGPKICVSKFWRHFTLKEPHRWKFLAPPFFKKVDASPININSSHQFHFTTIIASMQVTVRKRRLTCPIFTISFCALHQLSAIFSLLFAVFERWDSVIFLKLLGKIELACKSHSLGDLADR